jgi:hypothetical protein
MAKLLLKLLNTILPDNRLVISKLFMFFIDKSFEFLNIVNIKKLIDGIIQQLIQL